LAIRPLQMSLRLEWYIRDAPFKDPRYRDVTLADPLRAGSWTNVSVVLDGVPPKDLGYVKVVELNYTNISLKRPIVR